MWVSVRANVRVSSAARRSARESLQVWFSFLDALGICSSTIEFQIMSVSSKQIAVRAGGFSAIVVVCMAVFGVAILYSTFYVWLGVDSPGSMKVTDCKFLVHNTPENTLDYNPTCPPIIYLFYCFCKLQYHFVM
jgi:H+-translocating diphosphatase